MIILCRACALDEAPTPRRPDHVGGYRDPLPPMPPDEPDEPDEPEPPSSQHPLDVALKIALAGLGPPALFWLLDRLVGCTP